MTAEEDLKRMVIARLDNLPPGMRISVGSAGDFSAKELMEKVEQEDEIGAKFVEMELEFLRALKHGLIVQ